MPKVREVACRNEACRVDMFNIHYETYIPEEKYSAEYSCPGCGEQTALTVLSE